VDNTEADDVIAWIATDLYGLSDVVIASGDKDFAQLVDDEKGICLARPSKEGLAVFDESKVLERWGVYPSQMVAYLALMGDAADGLPGCRGVGPKTAEDLLHNYGDLEAIYEDLESLRPSLRKKLEASRQDVWDAYDLIKLDGEWPEGLKIKSEEDFDLQPAR
jgi:DNA polymerase-1